MTAVFGPPKSFRQCYGGPQPGHFALDAETLHWHHCREQFAVVYTQHTPGFFFSHPPEKGENIAEFLNKFEQILGLEGLNSPYPYSTFAGTGCHSVLWVEPSRFWSSCQMRRSLLTVLLRCGINYQNNFDEALFSDQYEQNLYARETKNALLRFMFGFTRYTGNFPPPGSYTSVLKHGWKEEFFKMDDAAIRRQLVAPETETPESSIIGIESLWA